MKPKFSIAIPAYHSSDYLKDAVRSCLAQTTHDFEVIVSDDRSADDLRTVAESFHDSRIRYSRNENRLGAVKNHQRAVSLATGEYVLLLNSDDLLLPDCLEIAGKALDDREAASAVYFSATYLVGSKIQGFLPMPKVHFADRRTLHQNPWLEKFHGTSPTCCLFRKSAFDLIGGFRESLRLAYDWELYMRFVVGDGGVIFLPRILSIYRKHDEQMNQARSFNGLYDMLDLWPLKEYSHWPSWEIANLALSELIQSVRRGTGWLDICVYILRSGVAWRLVGGVGGAIRRRIWCRIVSGEIEPDGNYESPVNVDSALRSANRFLGN